MSTPSQEVQDKEVFARGQPERVTDPRLTAEPLANPATVIERLHGTTAEQIATLGEE